MSEVPARKCKCCGDKLQQPHEVPQTLEAIYLTARGKEMCIECCAEIELGIIPKQTPVLHGTGGGRRVVRKTDPMS